MVQAILDKMVVERLGPYIKYVRVGMALVFNETNDLDFVIKTIDATKPKTIVRKTKTSSGDSCGSFEGSKSLHRTMDLVWGWPRMATDIYVPHVTFTVASQTRP